MVETATASSTAHRRTGAVNVVDMTLPRGSGEPVAKSGRPQDAEDTRRTGTGITDSTMNWRRMSFRRAPRALRTPISRMRSVTETSMMFMTTTPPTTRLIPVTNTVTT